MNGEAHKPDFITKSIHNPETGGKLTIIQKKDVLAGSIGHLLAIPMHTVLGRLQDVGVNPPPEMIDQLLDRYKDVPWKGEVTVRIDHVDPEADWKKTKERLQKEGKYSKLASLLGRPFLHLSAITTALFRADSFNSMTQTVSLFNPNIAVGLHELGHAEDLMDKGKRHRGLFTKLKREFAASKNAMRHFTSDEERKRGMKILEPAYATYISGSLMRIYIGAKLILKFAQLSRQQNEPISVENNTNKNRRAAQLANVAINILPIVIAHITSRLPNRKSSFGYIFSGEAENHPNLTSHQMLVATAKAI